MKACTQCHLVWRETRCIQRREKWTLTTVWSDGACTVYTRGERECKAKLWKTFTQIKSTVYKTHAQRHIHIHHLKKRWHNQHQKSRDGNKRQKAEGPLNENRMLLSRQQRRRPTSSRCLVFSAKVLSSFRKGSANIFFLWGLGLSDFAEYVQLPNFELAQSDDKSQISKRTWAIGSGAALLRLSWNIAVCWYFISGYDWNQTCNSNKKRPCF